MDIEEIEKIKEILTMKEMPGVIKVDEIWDWLHIERKRWIKELTTLIEEEKKEVYDELWKYCVSGKKELGFTEEELSKLKVAMSFCEQYLTQKEEE